MAHPARAHIGILPVETLGAIFLLATPVPVRFEDWLPHELEKRNDDQTSPITLSAVSKAWRDIAISTPSLWTSLWWKDGIHDPMLLVLYVERSGSLPLHLALSFKKRNCHTSDRSLVSPSVDCILLPNLSRIAILHLIQPPEAWLNQFDKLTSTTAMSISWSSWSSLPSGEVLLNKCRSLRRLRLFERNNHHDDSRDERVFYKLPYSLEELYLVETPLDTAIKLFLLSPNLVKFSAYCIGAPHQSLSDETSQWWFGQPSVFEHLEDFKWDRYNDDWASRLLSQVSTPRLRRLGLSSPGGCYIPVPPREGENQFFRRLPDTLSTLELVYAEVFSLANSPLFDSPSLENLILKWVEPKYIGDVFKGLTPAQGHQKRLPKLKNLSIWSMGVTRPFEGESELTPEHLQLMVTMLERRLVKGDVFRLALIDCALDWTPLIRGKLRSLKAKGVQLEIVEGDDAVDWLE